MAYFGARGKADRLGVRQGAQPIDADSQRQLFAEPGHEPRFVEIDRVPVRMENCPNFGGPWVAVKLMQRSSLDEMLKDSDNVFGPLLIQPARNHFA